MKIIDKLAWIEIVDKKILSTKSFGKDKYYIPGGKRDNFETDKEALSREIKEELSVELNTDTLKFIGVFQAHAHGHSADTFVKMTCYSASFTGLLEANSEIEEIIWLSYSDKDKISEVDKLIFNFLKESNMLD
ncbi:NUDIX hydrolase [Flavobacterium degerlachei]|jgi:8-oxo-dGTP pyrophosphatase MutT (NUDIX family)|uniref:NUDIX domain-containing protein n=1 Tax=Flavobacterium degerlachei TaxID=229203 RepID=A0A1H3D0Y1_9FLAO|nr:NUDIX domain-containing protein [Flavobacterium degerlachei]SDX59444.1 NUDIX domain-containing protein [Flavobacterium degerlachei]